MNQEIFINAYTNIDDFGDKLGEVIVDALFEEDNSSCEIAKCVIAVFRNCKTEKEFSIADDMLTAVCGYNIQSLVQKIKELDSVNYCWEGLYGK